MRSCLILAVIGLWRMEAVAQQSAPAPSLLQQRIDAAQRSAQANPKSARPFNDLAAAFCRQARDTGNPLDYDRASAALDQALRIAPGNYDARKLQVLVLLGKHEPADAGKLAAELNRQVPDDIAGWALLVDANVALGNRVEAERASQWILDLRPGSALGFEKAAEVRELLGDFAGAIDFFQEAFRRTSHNDADQQAWLLTEMARNQRKAGDLPHAEDSLREAAKLLPDSRQVAAGFTTLQAAKSKAAR